jgi:transcriptional regulator with XRE-family HTH domain
MSIPFFRPIRKNPFTKSKFIDNISLREVFKMISLGDRIREARKNKGLTQKQLADLIGAKHNSVSDWENNKNKPDPNTIKQLMKALDVDANTLLGWDNKENIKSDAKELAHEILNNEKIDKMLPLLRNLSDSDLNLVISFMERLNNKNS